MFSDKDVNQLIEGSYEIDCVLIKLTNTLNTSLIYEGSGSIFIDEHGQLTAKIYHVFSETSPEPFSHFGKEIVSGKLLGNEDYFHFEATSMSGRIWNARDVLPNFGGLSIPSCGHIILVKLNQLSSKKEIDTSTLTDFPSICFVQGKYSLPWNHYKERGTRKVLCQYSYIEGETSWNIEDFDQRYIKIEQSHKVQQTNTDCFEIFLESLSIACGKELCPIASIQIINNEVISLIYSIQNSKLHINSPFKDMPRDALDVSNFITKYCSAINKPWDNFYVHWKRLFESNDSFIENSALILCTSIEGLLMEYFPSGEVKSNFEDNEVNLIKQLITSNLGKSSKLRENLLNYLNRSPMLSVVKRLETLKNDGVNSTMIEAWSALRHKSAHGKRFFNANKQDDELQKVVNNYYACLGLFYQLLFIHIQYTGFYYDFSQQGWPYVTHTPSASV